MSQTAVPPQSASTPDPQLLGKAPVDPAVSEAGRLLCAGTYLDPRFRDRVIDELYVHDERVVAPSYGIDAARVLGHALRARRDELIWSAAVVAVWVGAASATDGWFPTRFLLPCLLLSAAAWAVRATRSAPVLRVPARLLQLYARLLMGFLLLTTAMAPLIRAKDSLLDSWFVESVHWAVQTLDLQFRLLPLEWQYKLYFDPDDDTWLQSPYVTLGLLLLLAVLVGLRHERTARTMSGPLSREHYADLARDPAERSPGSRLRLVRELIRGEQHWPVVMYATANPFCGAGMPFRPWHLSVELRPRTDIGPEGPHAVGNEEILRRVLPLVEALRVPSAHGAAQVAAAVLDRLRELVVDECVFLPVKGLRRREDVPVDADEFEEHRAGAIEEGGEKRRHFLRIRVGGWDEDIVVTVFVRVHTQGGMLMLEVAPHVLRPVRRSFQEADDTAQRFGRDNAVALSLRAVVDAPRALVVAVAALARGLVSGWRAVTAVSARARPTGPEAAVRELGADPDASLFQAMDVDRYLKTIQDRVARGVQLALYEAGWQTAEFEQKAVNLGQGAVYIQSMHNSAVGIGDSNTVSTSTGAAGGDKEPKRAKT
ncbi:hypothetical protein [Streptomyces chryseus]|uniref:hypothetical protein n=1 Tax=Streptomyces chryseus TaxID=68186 RepID=UPI001991811F|nr:hypothetical protein [Streptomyces chryseus]GGX25966.1 hypothetical protein GCM10010353_46230 [Streptomyces chryseus]